MFFHPAWAAGSYSSGPPAARTVGTKSTGGFYYSSLSPFTRACKYLSDVRAEGEELEEEHAAEVSAATRHEDGAPAKEAYDVRLGLERVGGRPLGANDVHVALIVVPVAHLSWRGEG